MGLINGHAHLLALIENKHTENYLSCIIITSLCLQWLLYEAISQTYCSAFVCPQPPRSCSEYWSEFKHCKSLRNRFQHYYAHGTSPSCQQWKEDYDMCTTWEKCKDQGAKVEFSFASIISLLWVMGSVYFSWVPQSNNDCNFVHNFILQEALRSSERSRLAEQKKFTPVWELRRVPPKDWHMPLNHERPQDSWTFVKMYFHYCGQNTCQIFLYVYLHYNIYEVWLPPPRVTLWAMRF